MRRRITPLALAAVCVAGTAAAPVAGAWSGNLAECPATLGLPVPTSTTVYDVATPNAEQTVYVSLDSAPPSTYASLYHDELSYEDARSIPRSETGTLDVIAQTPASLNRRWHTRLGSVIYSPERPMDNGIHMVDYRAVWHLADGSFCQIPRAVMFSVEVARVTPRESHRRVRYWMNRMIGALDRERPDLAERVSRAAAANVGDYRATGRLAEGRRRAWLAAMGRMGGALRAWTAHPSPYTYGRVKIAATRLGRAYGAVPSR